MFGNVLHKVKEISVQELKTRIDKKDEFILIDVREPHEVAICSIGGKVIPLISVDNNIEKFKSEKDVIVYCRSGKRSADAIRLIEKKLGSQNLYNLKGGILAWSDEIDNSVTKY